MAHCNVHGYYGDGFDGCPDCQHAERERSNQLDDIRAASVEASKDAARASVEAMAATMEAARRVQNPGDYQCPYCLMISLKRGARVCPICRSQIQDADRAAIERRVEELHQLADARRGVDEARHRAAAEELQQKRDEQKQRAALEAFKKLKKRQAIRTLYLVLFLVCLATIGIAEMRHLRGLTQLTVIAAIPVSWLISVMGK